MKKALVMVGVFALIGSAWAFRPTKAEELVPESPQPLKSHVVACVVDADPTSRAVMQIIPFGGMRLIAAGAGSTLLDREVTDLEPIELSSLVPTGTGVVGVEFSGSGGEAAIEASGETSLWAGNCPPAITATGVITAVSTDTGESTMLYLANPYAADAEVAVLSSSEQGSDNLGALSSIHIPARSVVSRNISDIFRLRKSVSLVFETRRGAFHALVIEGGSGDTMMVEARPGATEWFVPVPSSIPSNILVAPSTQQPTSVLVERFDGEWTTVFEEMIPVGEHLEFDATTKGEGPGFLRITSTTPVVAGISLFGDGYRAGGPGLTRLGYEWLAVGSEGRRMTLLIMNPNDVEGELRVFHGTRQITRTVPPESMIEVPLLWEGFASVESSVAVGLAWTAEEPGLAYSNGYTYTEWE